MATRMRSRRPQIRDFIAEDQRVICTEPFRPWMGRAVAKGAFYKLSDEIVKQFPQFFGVVIPVSDVLPDLIER